MKSKQSLLVSIRGYREATEAAKGHASIADVEYPASALGTPYPLNIHAVRANLNKLGYKKVLVSTNIGEAQSVRASACQAALGVAVAGADMIKFGLAEQSFESAAYLATSVIRTVRTLSAGRPVRHTRSLAGRASSVARVLSNTTTTHATNYIGSIFASSPCISRRCL